MQQQVILILLIICAHSVFSQSEENIVTSDNIIHVKTFGEGTPLLIINGGPGMNSDGFIPLAKKLGRSHKAIIYDQRGTGQSQMSIVNSKTITLDLMIQDIELIRNHYKIDHWVILGHSFGGMLASYYASKHSAHVKGLILSSSGGINMDLFSRLNISSRLSKKERDSLNHWNTIISNGDTSYYARLQRGTFLAPAYLYNKSNVPAVAERLTQGNTLINQLVYRNMRQIGFDCSEGLKDLKIPVLIIQGKQDLIDTLTAETAAHAIPNSNVVLLDECGHYGWLDQPESYFENIYNYLEKL